VQDATAIKQAELQARAALAEKEVLLREVHHRVKNNLEIILALAEMQRHNLDNENARQNVLELEARVRTIALVHEDLYRAENIAQVQARPYFSRLTGNLAQAFGTQDLELVLNVADVPLDVDSGILRPDPQ
jgi:two-component sensor histidine kinase